MLLVAFTYEWRQRTTRRGGGMPKQPNIVYRMVVNRQVALAAAGVAILGFVVVITCSDGWAQGFRETGRELGAALFGMGMLAIAWELAARRSFMMELLATVDMSQDLEAAGINQVCWNYLDEVNWKELFAKTDRLDVFVSYGRTWRNANAQRLEELSRKAGAEIRVALPDPNDPAVLGELARRFSSQPQEIETNIREAVAFFTALAAQASNGAKVEYRLVPSCPLVSFYLFSDFAVLTLHSHKRKRMSVPVFVADRGKTIYSFLSEEFEALWDQQPCVQPQQATPSSA